MVKEQQQYNIFPNKHRNVSLEMGLKVKNSSQAKVWFLSKRWIIASFNCDGTTAVRNERLTFLQMVGSIVLKHCFITVLRIGSKSHSFDVSWVISLESFILGVYESAHGSTVTTRSVHGAWESLVFEETHSASHLKEHPWQCWRLIV